MNLAHLRSEWAPNVTRELLAGTVVALALIPEAIAFSIIAGVDPKVGLYASFCIAGGRLAMISAATSAMALLMISLVKDHGVTTCSPLPSSPDSCRSSPGRSGSAT